MTSKTQPRKRGWWYPYIFVAAFMVVLGVNGALAYFATSTFTGLSTENAYEKGRLYNQALAAARHQDAMGWQVDTVTRPQAAGAAKVDIRVTYRDRDGKPVEGMAVRAAMARPTAKGHDHEVTLPAQGNGSYGGTFELPLMGVWDMDVVAYGNGASYQHSQRFVLK